ncbi:MAG: ROK family protein [Candidatus Pacebacteria bacterium]|nr:ROK family protein [Candidatus Paceibacterota bacterium]
MAKQKENVLGIDIGGSKINVVVWDGRGVVEQKRVNGSPKQSVLKAIGLEYGLRKIGVGVPGVFDAYKGQIIKCPNAPHLDGLNLKKLWPEKTVRIDNDVHCLLRAESSLGAAKGHKNVLAVAFGTGIGGGLMINGRILESPAGEVGHMIIDKGRSWEKLYQKSKNNPKEQERINAIGLANLMNIINPEMIVIGGGGVKAPKKQIIAGFLLAPQKQMPKIFLLKPGSNANAIGAALLFEQS